MPVSFNFGGNLMLLTIGMMVKNEEKYLEKCLEALIPILEDLDSELVIVDTGSDDNTLEIAKKFTDKVYFHNWNDNFSEMRNTVISYAKGDWYFSVDGDEIVINPQIIIDFFKSNEYKKYNSAAVNIRNFTDIKNNIFTEILVPRIFKITNDFKYIGSIHEQPKFKNPIKKLNLQLDHYGYIHNDEKLMEYKFDRNTKLLKNELEKDPNNIYYLFQLSKSYEMRGKKKKALHSIKKAYKKVKKNNLEDEYINVSIHLVRMLIANNLYSEGKNLINEKLKNYKGYIDLYYYAGTIDYILDNKKSSLDSFENYVHTYINFNSSNGKNDLRVTNQTISKISIVYKYLMLLYYQGENYVKVLEYGRKLDSRKEFKQVIDKILNSFIKIEETEKIAKFHNSLDDEELKNILIESLERKYLSEFFSLKERTKIISAFAKTDTEYGTLNKVRKIILGKDHKHIINMLSDINYNKTPNYYADIVYFIFKNKSKSNTNILLSIRDRTLNEFIKYLNKKYDDLNEVLYDFVFRNNQNYENIAWLRLQKNLSRYLLAFDNLAIDDYKNVFNNYLKFGTSYVKEIYSEKVIEEEILSELDNEISFLILLYKANQVKKKQPKKYICYLRKALKMYPFLSKGIEILLGEYKEKEETNNELEEYKNKTKGKIKNLIDEKNLEEANKLIYKYEAIVPRDPEIISMKSVIFIMQGEYENARELLEKAVENHNNNFDLLYNLAYVYQHIGEIKKSYRIAKKSLQFANFEQEVNDANDLIEQADVNDKDKKELIQNNNPIFIGGAGRSGTTLLRVMLNAHSSLCAGPEFKLLPNISNIYKQLMNMEKIKKAYSLNDDAYINKVFRNFISSFFSNHIINNDAIRLVEKTPHNILVMKELGSMFPEAKFIHMIRDGRDVVSSLLTKNWVGFDGKPLNYVENIEDAAKYWKNTVIKGINDGNNNLLKGRVKIVKYENLIEHTKEEIRRILEFIDEPWDKKVLEYYEVDRGYEPQESSTKQVNKKINKKSLNRWKNDFTKKDKKIFKKVAGDLLIDLGYEQDNTW
jgi:glycosyltransferase involved in cell wall biosynthesis